MSQSTETTVRKELLSAIRLHGESGKGPTPKADTRIVVRSLIVAGYTHYDIEQALENMVNRGEVYKPEEGKLAVV